jgi:hypothetical protein
VRRFFRPGPIADDSGPASDFSGGVPAAVLCAVCGRPDCAGCVLEAKSTGAADGAIPWEVRGAPLWRALWSTAHRSTVDGPAFFAQLSGKRILSPLRFALLSELCAIGSLAVVAVPLAYVAVPEWAWALWQVAGTFRLSAACVLAVVTFSVVMVALHALWAFGIELGLRIQGEPVRLAASLRYGLYACGWDLLTSPFGLVAGASVNGWSQAFSDTRQAMRVARSATLAYAERGRGVAPERARRALTVAMAVTGLVVGLGGLAVIALSVAIAIAT